MADTSEVRKLIQLHLKNLFKTRSQELSAVGIGVNELPGIDPKTGSWIQKDKASKTPRYLLQFRLENGQLQIGNFTQNITTGKIGHASTTARDGNGVPGLMLRTVPVFLLPDSSFKPYEEWEWLVVILFGNAISGGSSSDAITGFFPPVPTVTWLGRKVPVAGVRIFSLIEPTSTYIYTEEIAGEKKIITYGEATDALQKYLTFDINSISTPAPVYSALEPADLQKAVDDLRVTVESIPRELLDHRKLVAVTPTDDTTKEGIFDVDMVIPEKADLLGIDSAIYAHINAALKIKQHIMFYGPPGTGKTTLAEYVASFLGGVKNYILVTGTSDWTSQDIVGGYQPTGKGEISFVSGLMLDNFDKPIIIDELNRVDIDKAIGPLFTVLSGQSTTLPYLANPSADPKERKRIKIFPKPQNRNLENHEYAPTQRWRLLTTINTVDKASLYQMSYALSRRFAWILIDVPADLKKFVVDYLLLEEIIPIAPVPMPIYLPLSDLWEAVNVVRPLGAAPIIDIIKFCRAVKEDFDFLNTTLSVEQQNAYLSGFYSFLLPLLDGIIHSDAQKVIQGIIKTLGISSDSIQSKQLTIRVALHSI